MDLQAQEQSENYQRIASAIQLMVARQDAPPALAEMARYVGISESHLQRTFSAWAGVSPKKFAKYLTKQYAKQQLREATVFEAALASGLSGGGRLHDLMLSCESVTPGEFRRGGEGMDIFWGLNSSPFGLCFIASTQRGVCKLSFVEKSAELPLAELINEWPRAHIVEDNAVTQSFHRAIFERVERREVKLLLKGSPFQLQVWEALLRIPEGRMVSYSALASAIQKPKASRAVASAVASNAIGYLIPCHRVIRATGILGEYRWGAERKVALLGWEGAVTEHNRPTANP